MAELKLISPLLSNMEVESCISSRGGTSVYIVRSTKTNQTYILKHICVPESQKQVDALMFTGAASTPEEAQKYFEQVVSDYQKELEQLEALSSSQNLACFRSYQIVPKEDGVGYELYLLCEQFKTLPEYLQENAMTQLCAVNLGMDLCSALSDLRQAELIHRDVKPSNIYLSSQGHFVLGDLGIAPIKDLKYCSMPESMLSSYSAPELFSLIGTLHPTTDIYSVGLILYRIFNGNHGPFEDEQTSAKAADKRRVTGEALPAPMYADYEMSEIILKACAFQPEDRYQTPDELKEALVEYMKRNEATDTLIVPPIAGDLEPVDPELEEEIEPVQFADTEQMPEDFKQNFSPDTEMLNSIIDSVHKDMADGTLPNSLEPEDDVDDLPTGSSKNTRKRRRRSKWIVPVVCIVLLASAILGLVYYFVIAPSTIHVDSITVLDKGTDYITVRVASGEKDGAFGVICTDTYGNAMRQSFISGTDNTFTSLVPGAQYTFTVEPGNNEKLTGSYTAAASTVSQTEILSFTASTVSVTQCELNLIILEGPDPGIWTVSYEADGIPAKTATFEGHSTVIANLQSNADYTFTLLEPEGTRLTGEIKTTFSTVPMVDIESVSVALSSTKAILSWTAVGDSPDMWTVTVTGPDGYNDTQVVSATTVTLENLSAGKDYHVVISTPTMLQDVSVTVTPTVLQMTKFLAEADPDTNDILVHWELEADAPDTEQWLIKWHPTDFTDEQYSGEQTVDVSEGTTLRISYLDLIPGLSYEFSIGFASGEMLEGTTTASALIPTADKYTGHGMKSAYLGLFLHPNKEDFHVNDLRYNRSSFAKNEAIAFALQPIQDVDNNSEDMSVILMVRDENGKLADFEKLAGPYNWANMWENKLFIGSFPRTPQQSGKYVMEIYFNNRYVTKASFEVKE
ncbi:MAG: protein kinase [Clostridia bacterium]|nr:protein kinase [Clostridia bacterium]